MKKLFYRNILGHNPRKREISIEEVNDLRKHKVAKKWICKYFVKEKYGSDDMDDLRSWIRVKKREGCRRDCHILRYYNTETGANKIICKVLGDFFIIWNKAVYKIVYVNEIRIQVDCEG